MHIELNPMVIAGVGVCISIIFGITTLIFSRKNYALNTELAKRGALREPNIQVSVFDVPTSMCNAFIVASKLRAGFTYACPMQVTLANKGNKSANKVKLLLRFPVGIHHWKKEYTSLYKENNLATVQCFDDKPNSTIVMVQLKDLAPGEGFNFVDLLTLEESFHEVKVPLTFKDGAKANATVKISFQWYFDYTVFQEDFAPVAGRVDLRVFNLKENDLARTIDFHNLNSRKAGASQSKRRVRLLVSKEENVTEPKKGDQRRGLLQSEGFQEKYDGYEDTDGTVHFKAIDTKSSQ